ncbi:MAG: efflux RND transporter periplasmic adaptor subunit [Rubrivivax sp.]|jgi:putative peptide zinc metalloprotease protein|nr:efflux RND transporter periplasmic adaptor subunit [Rubrivivax sp.]
MTDQSKKVALPAYLPRRLDAFRIVRGDQTSYILRDKLLDKTHDLEPWQFFVLEVLPGCETAPKLLSVFEDRFGRKITEPEVLGFFGWLADQKLLDADAENHPLLKPFTRPGYAVEQGLAKPKSFEELAAFMAPAGAQPAAPAAPAAAEEADLPPGVIDADNLDPRRHGKVLWLFSLQPFVRFASPFFAPLKWAIYVVPVLALTALFLLLEFGRVAVADLRSVQGLTTLASHVVFSLFTVNLFAVLTQATVAHHYRATVSDMGVALYLGFLPRLVARIRNVRQLNRRERMWVHGGPLLMRLFLFSLGVLVWYNSRDGAPLLSQVGLSLAFIAGINMIVGSANPLVRGNGYHLLAAFIDEPHLRGKAYRAFMNRLRGGPVTEKDSNVLAGYALATFLYIYVIGALAVYIVANFLQRLELGGAAYIVAGVLGLYLLYRSITKFRRISQAYDRAMQFDRWRKRALPAEGGETLQTEEPQGSRTAIYLRRALALSLLLLLFLPYPYEPGGDFQVFPSERQVLTTDVPGIVEEVFFDGGEQVRKGTVVARLASTDLQAQVATLGARIAEQEAVIADLRAKPKREEILVAQKALETALERARFSAARVPRTEKLYRERLVSFEEFDAVRKEAEVDAREVAQREAALALAKVGTTPQKLQAEQARLDSLREERAGLEGRVRRTELVMPFDGTILTLRLRDRKGSVLERGQPFATVENARSVTAEIEVPESEIGFVRSDGEVRARLNAFSDQIFTGRVATIDRNVTTKEFGNVVKVVATIDNLDGRIKSGMTGHAKVQGETMPVWRAFSLALQRFFAVQVWSWIP